MSSEVEAKADFSLIRYAQCWEDADILLEALEIQPGDVCLSIASAGDNALAMISRGPKRVIALDLNPAQLACLELRVAAYRELSHPELLDLIGDDAGGTNSSATRRNDYYQRCRAGLSSSAREFWDAHPNEIAAGIGSAGKFERYFALFRKRILPLVHGDRAVQQLLCGGTTGQSPGLQARREFYARQWDTWRWRLLFRIFFSRFVMGRMGRDPSFFAYVEGSVADRILDRTRHALTELDPAANPYMQWILTGRHVTALPFALRPENFEAIRANLDCLEWRCQSIEDFLESSDGIKIDRYNLSDIFEYMAEDGYHRLLKRLIDAGRPGGRLAYWNMLAPRSRPESFAARLVPLTELARKLHEQDKAFFYSRFVVEEIAG